MEVGERALCVCGTVASGSQKASRLSGLALQERRVASGSTLTAGTLNVDVPDLIHVIKSLPMPMFLTDDHAKGGALRWWEAILRFGRLPDSHYSCFLVRHERTRTGYLELMSETRFRTLGIEDGDQVELALPVEGSTSGFFIKQ